MEESQQKPGNQFPWRASATLLAGAGERRDKISTGRSLPVTRGARQGWSCSFSPLLPLAEEACVRTPLQKQQSLPLRPVIPLVARISDQNASGAPPMTVREKTRLEKFKQLLSSHNTDLGECGEGGRQRRGLDGLLQAVMGSALSSSPPVARSRPHCSLKQVGWLHELLCPPSALCSQSVLHLCL